MAGPEVHPGSSTVDHIVDLNHSTADAHPGSEAPLSELISATTRDLSSLFRSEVELAKVELKEEVQQVGKAGGMLGAGALFAFLTLTMLCFAAAWGLSEIVPEGVAFLIVAVIVGIIAAVLVQAGRSRLARLEPVPRQTVETLQEDVQWAKRQLS